jgi:CRP-like cAMP-binding protein
MASGGAKRAEHVKNFNWKDLLTHHPVFGNLNEKERERLLTDDISEESTQSPGSLILKEGEFGNSIFLIGSGSVQIVLQREDGRDIPLALLHPGALFGEMALFQSRRRTATVIAKESCWLLEVKGEEFLKLLSEHPEVELKVFLTLTERLRHMNEQVLAVQLKDIDEKFSLFNRRLEAELKVFDSALKASQALFEQTKIRTDEVITSAERRQTSQERTLRFFGAVVSLVLAVGGWFGFSKFSDLTERLENTKTLEEQATVSANKAELSAERARKQEENLAQLPQINANLARTLLSLFSQAMTEDPPSNGRIITLYRSLLPLRSTDSVLRWRLLGEIERGMVKTQGKNIAIYQDLLPLSIREAQVPKEKIIAHYLFLSSLLLDVNKDNEEKQKGEFAESFAEFQQYVQSNNNQRFRNELDFSMLKELFDRQEHQKNRDLFQQITGLIP